MISFLFGIIEIFEDNKFKYIQRLISLILIGLIFIVFSFNKNNYDYWAYLEIFKTEAGVESGYLYIIKIIKIFGGNHQIIVFLIGTILTLYLLFKLLKKTKYPLLIILLYFSNNFLYDLNQIRNTLCYIIILFALDYLKENKNSKYIFLNLLAITFQRTGIIYLFYFLLSKLKQKNYYKMITLISIGGMFILPIFKIIMLKMFPDKASVYFATKISKGYLLYYILFALDLFILKITDAFENQTKEDEIYLKFILFPAIFLPYGLLSTDLVSRPYRNALLIKWIFTFKKVEFKKMRLKIVVLLLSLIGVALPILITYYKDKEYWLKLVNYLQEII